MLTGTTKWSVAFGNVTSMLVADGQACEYGSFACAPTGLSPYSRSKLAIAPGGRATGCGTTLRMRYEPLTARTTFVVSAWPWLPSSSMPGYPSRRQLSDEEFSSVKRIPMWPSAAPMPLAVTSSWFLLHCGQEALAAGADGSTCRDADEPARMGCAVWPHTVAAVTRALRVPTFR